MERGNFLIVAHLPHFFVTFLEDNIFLLQQWGFSVHCASNFALNETEAEQVRSMGAFTHQIDVQRSPYSPQNLKAIRQLAQLMRQLDAVGVHCHTPTGGMVARLAARAAHVKPVYYTAHGFHFYTGAPLKNWLLYYPVERFLAHFTDVLITINREDYTRAQTFKAGKVCYVPGIGIDLKKFDSGLSSLSETRRALGFAEDDIVLLSVGELIPRKNHAVVIRALAVLRDKAVFEKLQYVICGVGRLEADLKGLVQELELTDKVHFLGYRNDISEICGCSDIFLFMSLQEGLPVALMEAMACGTPIICSNIRGNTDLVEHGISAYLAKNDEKSVAAAIEELIASPQVRDTLAENARAKIEAFDLDKVQLMMRDVYAEELGSESIL